MKSTPFILLITVFCTLACQAPLDRPQIIGVKAYSYNGDLSMLFDSWKSAGINTLFISPELAGKPGFMDKAKEHDMPVYLIVPTFYNSQALKEDTSLYAITSKGKKATEDWVEFICPNNQMYRQEHLDNLVSLVENIEPAGISIDFIRYFVYWEQIGPEATIEDMPQTCFCNSCVDLFTAQYNINIPVKFKTPEQRAGHILQNYPEKWTGFKCQTITGYVEKITTVLDDLDPGLKYNLHFLPWTGEDLDGAIRKIAGQDLDQLSPFVDYISPMCYSHMLRKDPKWVEDVVKYFSILNEDKILPSLQVKPAYRDEKFTVGEFETALKNALLPPSEGVIFWSWESLERSPAKRETVARICNPPDN